MLKKPRQRIPHTCDYKCKDLPKRKKYTYNTRWQTEAVTPGTSNWQKEPSSNKQIIQ